MLRAAAVIECHKSNLHLLKSTRGCLHLQNVFRCMRAAWRREGLRGLMSQLPAEELSIAGHAAALAAWHSMHAFCGRFCPHLRPRPGLRPRSRLRPRPCLRPYHRRRSPPLPSLGNQPGDNSRPLCIQFQFLFQPADENIFRQTVVLRVEFSV